MSVMEEPTHVTARLHATIMEEVIPAAVIQVTVEIDTPAQVNAFDHLYINGSVSLFTPIMRYLLA